ncbi:MAG: DUF4381 domain-containing protein [Granulosicoccus sp.]|nr:DUF4381 domain-containing protein [Granulosicoccus sp.]
MDPSGELLSQLEGLDLPARTGLGIAPGWWILLIALLLGLLALVLFLRRRPKKENIVDWRPQAGQELARIRRTLETTSHDIILSDCSRIARRIALAVAPREDVASLHGQAWMRKLDELSHSSAFTEGQGGLLLNGPYQMKPGSASTDKDLQRLHSLVDALEELLQAVSGDAK